MAADKIKIEIDADTRQAVTSMQKLEAATRDVERETKKLAANQQVWRALTTDVSKLGEEAQKAAPRLAALGGSFARIVATAGAATAGVGAATMAIANAAARAEQNQRAVALLGDAYHSVTDATMGTVTAQEALRVQQGLVQSGLQVTGDQLGTITRAAREYALATGTETTQAVEQLSDALRGMESEGLQRFNVTVQASGDRTRDFAAAVDQLANRQAGMTTASRTMAEEINGVTQAFERMVTSLAGAIARSTDLANILRFISDTFDDQRLQRNITGDAALMRSADRARERGRARAAVDALAGRGVDVEGLRQALAVRGLDVAQYNRITAFATNAQSASPTAAAAMVRELTGSLQPAIDQQLQQDHAANQRAAMEAEGERKRRKANESAAQSAEQLAEAMMKAKERTMGASNAFALALSAASAAVGSGAARSNLQSLGSVLGLQGMSDDEMNTLANEIVAGQEGGGLARREETARTQRIAARDRETRRRARTESFGGRVAAGLGFGSDDEGRIAPFNAMTEGATMLTSVVGTLTNGLTSLFDTLVTGSADAGTAFQAFASGLLTELGKMAVQKGLFYTFEGIAALFSAPPAAPLYFAAGAGLLALGAGLGLAGSAIKPQVPAPGAGSDLGAARGLAPRSASLTESSGLGGVTVVMSSLVPAGPADAQRVRDGQRHASRMGFGDRVPRRVEF